ncbi:bacillithiol biosynthesis cysteine-adding enzyme BshC [Priestia koreensis]|uniref:bacillithiol biosynthesis cysteine-adding enzyme BshC n=1 Tax=Priestia koreensis TaxID=284581 RepID=UPI001F57166C|nr:bacillithiol biosynthesis cysteine-adding enzyme BshC [Priestia koreensis]UNL83974.1 bacillithiol biosynthesis cysteine-adding enzyme BshC [Priestia koreensis]
METIDVALSSLNKLTTDYVNGEKDVSSFFHYDIAQTDLFRCRQQDIKEQHYPRKELIDYLLPYNSSVGSSEQTLANIRKLNDSSTTVVVGGQQAGVLTGPLYTIHKIISILKLAKEQEQALGSPVLPVFWIAGEDHDFAEVNHVFVEQNGRMVKKAVKEKLAEKKMVSDTEMTQELVRAWVDDIFKVWGETNHTKEVRSFIQSCLQSSRTYTEFFARMIAQLFAHTGLILMDAASPELRKLESPFFVQLIEENMKLSEKVGDQQSKVEEGYKKTIDVAPETAHLFYSHQNERILLERTAEGFAGKNGEVQLTKEELLHIAHHEPHLLSNNVVTRPLMQEFVLPTLAFIAGPGEVAYWAELKQAFELFGFRMPPVMPRLSYVIVERSVQKALEDVQLDLTEVLQNGLGAYREKWLSEEVTYPYANYFEQAKTEIESAHQLLRTNVLKEDERLGKLLEKNRNIIQNQLNIAQKIVESEQLKKHETILNKYTLIENALTPSGGPQERTWNVAYYLNQYGMDFVAQLLEVHVEFNHKLKAVCL